MGILISLARVSVQPQQPHKASFQNLLKFPSRSTREAVRKSDSAPSSDEPVKHQLAKEIPVRPATVDSPPKVDYATELFYMMSMDVPKNDDAATSPDDEWAGLLWESFTPAVAATPVGEKIAKSEPVPTKAALPSGIEDLFTET
ncbi:hypothetical protein QQ045_002377 [Rhodiola kirilowii]